MSGFNLLQLSHIKVQNANALSSPFTIGFPAMTAWLGFMHALERKLRAKDFPDIVFHSLTVISHECDLQTYKGANDFVYSIIGTGNPLDKDGGRSAFIEEARCHLDISLLINYDVINDDEDSHLPDNQSILDTIRDIIMTMKMAGGDILSIDLPKLCAISSNDENGSAKRKILNSLMPGYALIERRELMIEAMNDGQDAMDSLLDYVTVNNQCVKKEDTEKFEWCSSRKTNGWIVPIATGFHGLSSLGEAKNQRDFDVPHRFSESLITLGQFVMVNKIDQMNEMLWEYRYDKENNLYICQQVESKYISNGE